MMTPFVRRLMLQPRARARFSIRVIAVASLCCTIGVPLAALADDSEVFFTRRSAADDNEANVLFMFDTSGSMAARDGGTYRRITRMKQAMIDVIDNVDSVNIGIGAFNGLTQGGAILYPATAVDDDVCENAACDEISLQVPVREENDDGEQRSDGTMSLNDSRLYLSYQEPGNASVSLRVPIGTGADDAVLLTDDTLKSDATELNFFHADGDSPVRVGLRFADIPVPAGSQVVSAYVEFEPVPGGNAGVAPASITVDTAADSLPFSDTGAGRYDARVFSDNRQSWGNIANNEGADNTATRTPDISDLINEPIRQSGWQSGNAITLGMTLPDGARSDAENQRTFKSFESGTPPTLVLRYHTDGFQQNTVGLRFADVQIPRGATVTRAVVDFSTAAVDSQPSTMTIQGEKVGNSAAFAGTMQNFSSRARSTNQLNWVAPAWEGTFEPEQTVDIRPIVEEIIDQDDWCGGNALSLFFEGNGLRRVQSRDRSLWDAPVLKLSYEPSSVDMNDTCLSQQVTSRIADGNDDAIEALATSNLVSDGIALSTRQAASVSYIGLRFAGLDIPQGARIGSAYLELRSPDAAASVAGPTVRIQNTGDAGAFTAGLEADLSARPLATPSVVWPTLPKVEPGEVIRSPNLAALITAVTSRSDWRGGNALMLRLQNDTAGAGRAFSSYETEDLNPARLVVNYQIDDPQSTNTPVVLRSGRDALRDIILDFRASGGTPLLDAYYEAAQYLTGRDVDFGLTRGRKTSGDRIFRTSIKSSWEQGGGSLLRPDGCTELDLDSEACAGEEITGSPDYDAPTAGICQANQIVLLSDGNATHNTSKDRIRGLTGVADCGAGGNDACGVELAQWLSGREDDAQGYPTNVVTHTVGFNFSGDLLKDLAREGGGGFYTASSASELSTVFRNIIADTVSINTGFVAPAATVSQFNRLTNRDDVYYAMFRPGATPRWAGNLKRYRVGKPEGSATSIVLDAAGNAVINEDTGQINTGARSFWSSGVDGANVSLGGAANELSLSGRQVKTFVYDADAGEDNGSGEPVAGALIDLAEDTDAIDAGLLGIDTDDTAFRTDLLKWARGVDVLDTDEDGNVTEVRSEMGDPMHSAPFILNYASTAEEGRSVVFVGTNEGFLHAIDTSDGSEEFAFMPPELLGNLKTFYTNEAGGSRPYGLDGAVTGWMEDTNGNLVIDTNEKAYVVVGMRRGGRNYYALDVSDPTAPVLEWVIHGGVGDFAELGQSWSKPVPARLRVRGTPTDVLIFAGGYDTGNDTREERGSGDDSGRALFVVDRASGQLLGTYDADDNTAMDYSLPSDVNVVDWNLDGLSDYAFVGDMGGQIWRFDFDNESSGSINSAISGGVIADFGNTGKVNNRRFFYPPDVALIKDDIGQTFLNVAVGSGWRSHPLDERVQDRFYVFRDAAVQGPPRNADGVIAYTAISDADEDDLIDATEADLTTSTSTSSRAGWYIDLAEPGEKVLGSSVTVNGQVLFTSYVPDSDDQNLCSVSVGSGRLYAMDIFTAGAVFDVDGSGITVRDRSRPLKTEGIPPPVSVLLLGDDEGQVAAGLESVKDVDFGPSFKHTHWAEE